MLEFWTTGCGIDGVLVSNLGRVQLPVVWARMPNGGQRKYIPKPTKGAISCAKKGAKHKYRNIYNRKFGNLKVHQLVCEAFHGPRPSSKHGVIHIDENGLNNRPENLKWGTQKENLNMPKFIAYCRTRRSLR